MIQERLVFRTLVFSVFTLDLGFSRFSGIGFSGLLIGFSQDFWIWFYLDIGVLVNQSIINYYKHIVKKSSLQANKRLI